MRIPLTLLPEHLQIAIVEKQALHDFRNFHITSMESYKILKKIKTRFFHNVEYLFVDSNDYSSPEFPPNVRETNFLEEYPIRIVARGIDVGSLTGDFSEWLANFISTKNLCVREYLITAEIKCSPEQLNTLLLTSSIGKLMVYTSISMDHLKVAAMEKIEYLEAKDTNNDDVPFLQMPEMVLDETDISASGVNRLLKEWLKGERNIHCIRIIANRRLNRTTIFNGVPFVDLQPSDRLDSSECLNSYSDTDSDTSDPASYAPNGRGIGFRVENADKHLIVTVRRKSVSIVCKSNDVVLGE